MFGYIKPNIPELRVRDNELYKATYCGLCRAMGKCTGCASKFTLSYDFAFLALVRMVLEKTRAEIKMRRCIVHPLKKRPMLEINSTLEYSAKASVILTRMKLKDNINDSHGLKRLKAKIVGAVSLFFKKTDKELIPLEEKVRKCIENLTALEKANCDSLDEVASTFGELLGSVAAFGLDGMEQRLGYEIGFHLGKWIYVIDACDDFDDDVKSGSYNALISIYGNELKTENKKSIKNAIYLELSSMSRAIELVDFTKYRDVENIIKNVIYDGIVKVTEEILKTEE